MLITVGLFSLKMWGMLLYGGEIRDLRHIVTEGREGRGEGVQMVNPIFYLKNKTNDFDPAWL